MSSQGQAPYLARTRCPKGNSNEQEQVSAHAYAEDQPVEQPAIGLFAELGWQTVSAMEETFGATRTLLPRLLSGQVNLV